MNASSLQTASMEGQKIHCMMDCHIFYWNQVVDENDNREEGCNSSSTSLQIGLGVTRKNSFFFGQAVLAEELLHEDLMQFQ